jgi:transcriptional antiterminator
MTQQITTQESKFFTASEVAQIMQVSSTSAYRIIAKLNDELKQQGKITIGGKISKRYFNEKVYI